MKLLVLGGNGQVGFELLRALKPLGEVVATTRTGVLEDGTPCEVADFDQPQTLAALVDRIAPDVVVNAAAWTAVDKAETEQAAAARANAEAPAVLARACAARGALLVHYSTDYVFPGDGSVPYREDDATAPLGVYGATKLAGEDAIRASGARHMIFRTAWVYAARGGNFLRTMLRVGAQRDQLGVVADQVGTPTPAWLIADATAAAIANTGGKSGTWHLTASGVTSWHGFAEAIFADAVQRGLLERAPHVAAITTAEYPTPAKRPAYSCLDNTRFQHDFGFKLPQWEAGLQHVMGELSA
ncbi:dTDP-4-dehydrorhamnose reductase [Pseudoxanthomonas sp. GM95]|uniref:dTDP-4-dehydrorhamnose reductase n=1 Tax=Pseudoxanthomonas sp. GM95 TaxID=1881043 RepID=UPI0008CFC662|nr:dTDP-4-dehydrorhamnose reductase [Pseudoxanthomonas sp. GM95]SEM44781.1 dTDP-4-dehydrorhamnose reductase [Pseudoxanthomonas sp. GM95]